MHYFTKEDRRRAVAIVTGSLIGLAAPVALGVSVAQAAGNDRDGDGMPNRWERRHDLHPGVANARGDSDRDGLSNIAEFRLGIDPSDEDSDADGHDDKDEVRDGLRATNVRDADTDDDGILDGDEDADRDGVDNEDEDDARERCRFDDDDLDDDHVDDEDENELGLDEDDSDSDGDGVEDGDEDADEDGEANEDLDDLLEDRCGRDGGEDLEDVMGTIVSFEAATGTLTINSLAVGTVWFVVTEETEIEVEGGDEDGSTADLVAGTLVAEVGVDGETGALEEIALYAPGLDPDDR